MVQNVTVNPYLLEITPLYSGSIIFQHTAKADYGR